MKKFNVPHSDEIKNRVERKKKQCVVCGDPVTTTKHSRNVICFKCRREM